MVDHRTRLWEREDRTSSTCVQFRTDATPMVWMHTNIGWLAISNAPPTAPEAEKMAEDMARGYDLTESPPDRARYFAWPDGDPSTGDDE